MVAQQPGAQVDVERGRAVQRGAVDQAAGRRAGPEPLRTLSQVRRGPDGGVLFGVYLAVERPGRVCVGDQVRLEQSPPGPAGS